MNILITGGTGSFGKAFVRRCLSNSIIKRIVVFSRDELKQYEMQSVFTSKEKERLRFFLGDIRDKDRLIQAFKGVDTVIHAAALKQVPAAEYNPMEFIKTNIIGSENVVQAALTNDVKNVVALSTDKAASPANLYGATKLCADKLFIAANNIRGEKEIKFSVVRYGNVMGSRGSVIPFFLSHREKGFLPVTDLSMTRFNISLEEGVDMVFWAINNAKGGEIFVPKIPSYRITDLAEAIAPNCDLKIIGIRPGEKIHEQMITQSDSQSTLDLGKYFAVLPSDQFLYQEYLKKNSNVKTVPFDFVYDSNMNTEFLTVQKLRILIKENVNSNFSI